MWLPTCTCTCVGDGRGARQQGGPGSGCHINQAGMLHRWSRRQVSTLDRYMCSEPTYMYMYMHTASFSFLKAVSSFTISLSFSNASVLYIHVFHVYVHSALNLHVSG